MVLLIRYWKHHENIQYCFCDVFSIIRHKTICNVLLSLATFFIDISLDVMVMGLDIERIADPQDNLEL